MSPHHVHVVGRWGGMVGKKNLYNTVSISILFRHCIYEKKNWTPYHVHMGACTGGGVPIFLIYLDIGQ